jgi:hypothetical protein
MHTGVIFRRWSGWDIQRTTAPSCVKVKNECSRTSTPYIRLHGVHSNSYTSCFISNTSTASSWETPLNFCKKPWRYTPRYGKMFTVTDTVGTNVGRRHHGIIMETTPRNGKTMDWCSILSTRKKDCLCSRWSIPALGPSEPRVLSVFEVKWPRFEDGQSLPKGPIAGWYPIKQTGRDNRLSLKTTRYCYDTHFFVNF